MLKICLFYGLNELCHAYRLHDYKETINSQVLVQAYFFSKGIPSLAKIVLGQNISWNTWA